MNVNVIYESKVFIQEDIYLRSNDLITKTLINWRTSLRFLFSNNSIKVFERYTSYIVYNTLMIDGCIYYTEFELRIKTSRQSQWTFRNE